MFFIRVLLLWFPMLALAIVNGVVRETTYGKRLPELTAHQISSFTGSLSLFAYIWLTADRLDPGTAVRAWLAGGVWALMTVIFEFAFGRLYGKHSWERLLGEYNLAQGRLWTLVLFTVALGPYLAFTLRQTP